MPNFFYPKYIFLHEHWESKTTDLISKAFSFSSFTNFSKTKTYFHGVMSRNWKWPVGGKISILFTERSLQYNSSLEGSIFKFSPYGPSLSRLIALPLLSIFFLSSWTGSILKFCDLIVLGGGNPASPLPTPLLPHTHTHLSSQRAISLGWWVVLYINIRFFFSGGTACLKPCSLFTSIRAHLLQANDLSIFLLLLKSFWLFA